MPVGQLLSKEAAGRTEPERWICGRVLRAVPIVLVGMGLLLYAYRLGRVDFWSEAEGRSAMVARHLLAGGDWLLPEPPHNFLIEAPPFYGWLVASCFWTCGSQSEAAARIPSALAAVVTLIVMYRHGCRLGSQRLGRTAALATGLCVLFVWQARLAEADAVFCLWVALAYSAAPRAINDYGGHFAVLHAALGLAILTKGIVALLFIAAPLAVYLTWQHQWHRVLGRGAFWGTLPVLLTLGGAWYAYVLLRVPQTLHELSWLDFVQRTGHHEPLHYYVTRLPLALLPVTFILPWAVALPWKRADGVAEPSQRLSAARLAFCWLVVPLIVLLFWPGKQTHYVLPLVPALGLLAALVLEGRTNKAGFWSFPSREHGAKLAAWLIPAVCAIAAPVLATRGHPAAAWLLLAIAAVLTLVSLAARISLDWSRRFGLEAVLVELWIVLLVVCGHLMPQFNLEKSHKPFLRAVRRLVPADEPLTGVHLRANDLYYLNRPVTRLRPHRVSIASAGYVIAPRRWLDSQPGNRYLSVLQSDRGNGDELVLVRTGMVVMGTVEPKPKR